jgi:hypothetical protein
MIRSGGNNEVEEENVYRREAKKTVQCGKERMREEFQKIG